MTTPAPSRAEQPEGRPRRSLQADECRAVIDSYCLHGVRGARDYSHGNPAAPKAIIEAEAGRFLLKRRAPGLDDFARMQAEHAAQISLQRAGLPVPAPLATRDGETIAVLESRLYELYPFVDAEPFSPSADTALAAGAVLAGLHETLGRIDHAGRLDVENHDRVERAFAHLAATTPGLRNPLERLRHDLDSARLHREGLDFPRASLTHGDYHPGNTLWRGRDIAAVVDFETMRPSRAVEETSLAALYFALDTAGGDPNAWPDAPDASRLEAFWAGYGAVERFDSALIESAPWLMIEGLIAEALPRACRSGGFRRHETGEMLPFIARTTAWLAEHADGLGVVLSQAGH